MLAFSRDIEAPADRLWDLLVETRYWSEWGPSVRLVEGPARIGLGDRGRVRTAARIWLSFEITAFDESGDERHWSWKVAGAPATDHRVVELSPQRCRVSFGVPWWAAPYGVVCRVALSRLERLSGL